MDDPIKRAEELARVVTKGDLRKYYRFRPARFYGGIATADCVLVGSQILILEFGKHTGGIHKKVWFNRKEDGEIRRKGDRAKDSSIKRFVIQIA